MYAPPTAPTTRAPTATLIWGWVKQMPGFGDYAVKTDGIRKIPVLELKRA